MVNIAVMGYGTVGSGVVEVINTNSAVINQRAGDEINIKYVLDLRDFPGDPIQEKIIHDVDIIINDPEIKIVVEVMGGIEPAYTFVKRCLEAGKSVATSNKALVAKHGAELLSIARERELNFLFEASVGGGIPILRPLTACLAANELDQITGILNGTTNYILTRMVRAGATFADALREAQEKGYAEADPSADIDGDDIRRKLTISANIAFDALLREEDIPAFGIRTVTGADVADFRAHGFTCKLLACAQRTETGVAAYVEPALVAEGEPEAAVPGNYNLISCTGELLGRQSYFGQGAGRYPTAANVVQDCLDLLTGEDGFYTETARPMAVEADAVAHPYYVRTQGADPWLKSVTADRWAGGVITGAVPVGQMLRWAAAQRQRDPGCFVAGIR